MKDYLNQAREAGIALTNDEAPQFRHGAWTLAIGKVNQFQAIVFYYGERHSPQPSSQWLARHMSSPSDQKKGWAFRVGVDDMSLKDLLAKLNSETDEKRQPNSIASSAMGPTLRTVNGAAEVLANVDTYAAGAGNNVDLAVQLAKTTTYWVQDPDTGSFGPGKFCGFSGMDFVRYRAARQHATGARFDGNVAHLAIEKACGDQFRASQPLATTLTNRLEASLGGDVLKGVDAGKWQFLTPSVRHYWAFLADPETYNVRAAVSELVEDTWTTKRSAVKAGDRAVIWMAQGSGKQRGVVALAEVLSDPTEKRESIHTRRYWRVAAPAAPEPRVDIRYVVPPAAPLWLDEDKNGILESLSVARARGGSVFSIEPAQWAALVAVLGGWPDAIDGLGPLAALADPRSGQGFSSSPKVRMAVEQRAMDLARAHYRDLGYTVETHGKPYDLLCTKGEVCLHVEVKGTRSAGEEVLLTPNEVTFARSHESEMALFVVSSMGLEFHNENPVATGGEVRVIQPWAPLDEQLTPTGFTCRLPKQHSND